MMRVRLLTVMVTATALAACGESTAVLGDLTEAEASELASAVFATAFTSMTAAQEGPSPAPGGPQMAPFTYSRDVAFTVGCALDGEVDVTASLDVTGNTESDAGRIEYSMTHVHHGCRVASHNDIAFTLDGAPSVTVVLVAERDELGHATVVGSLDGRVDWAREGREGTCEIVLDFSGSTDETAGTAEFDVSGSVCRLSVDASGSIG